MKSFVDFIKESEEAGYVWTVYDESDGTIINVFDTEEEAKKAAEESKDGADGVKPQIKKEKRDTVEK